MDEPQEVSVLVIRAWVDPVNHQFRARVIETSEPDGTRDLGAFATAEDLVAAVRSWATGLEARA